MQATIEDCTGEDAVRVAIKPHLAPASDVLARRKVQIERLVAARPPGTCSHVWRWMVHKGDKVNGPARERYSILLIYHVPIEWRGRGDVRMRLRWVPMIEWTPFSEAGLVQVFIAIAIAARKSSRTQKLGRQNRAVRCFACYLTCKMFSSKITPIYP